MLLVLSGQMNENLKEESPSRGNILARIKRFFRKRLRNGMYLLILYHVMENIHSILGFDLNYFNYLFSLAQINENSKEESSPNRNDLSHVNKSFQRLLSTGKYLIFAQICQH